MIPMMNGGGHEELGDCFLGGFMNHAVGRLEHGVQEALVGRDE
jgi:hypothetical protein